MVRSIFGRAVLGLAFGGVVLGLAGCGGGGSKKSATSSASIAASTSQQGSASPITSSSQLALPAGTALHAAVVLPTGDVLVMGGVDPSGNPTDATYIINSNGATPGPRMSTPRVGHTATALSSGQVIVAGGRSDAQGKNILDTTEVFDPLARTFTPGPKLSAKRTDHVAVSFGPAGAERILIASGATTANGGLVPLASAEVLDPATMASAPIAAKLAEARAGAVAAKLDDGTILIASGETGAGAAGAELFDPAAQTFAPVTAPAKRSGAAMASTGREACIVGGQTAAGIEASTDGYDMVAKSISVGPRLATARRDTVAVKTPSGIVISGGRDTAKPVASVEVLDGASLAASTLKAAQPLVTARWGHSASVLSNGLVLVVGGFDASGVPLASIEVVDPTATTVATASAAPSSTSTSTPSVPTSSSSSGAKKPSFLSNLLKAAANAAVATIANKPSGGIGGFFQAFLGNLLNNLLGGGTGAAGSGSAGSSTGNIFTSILGSLLGGNAPGNASSTSSTSTSSAPPSSSTSSSSSSSSGGFFSSILNFFKGLFGGGSSSSSSSSSSSASTNSGGAQVLSVLPIKAHVGDQVTIVGLNWGTTAEVLFNGVSTGPIATTPNGAAKQVVVQVPAGATSGSLVVVTNNTQLSAGTFTVY